MFNNNIYNYNKNFKKIIIIGDIHGDIKRLKNLLINENIINNNLEWLAHNIIIIQLGDQLDSLNRIVEIEDWEILNDIEVVNFTNILSKLALLKNSLFISLNGNHELMNILGNFSYVSKKSLNNDRINLFNKKGIYRNILAYRPLVVKINNLIFCHAGIKKHHLDILDKYNKDIFYINDIWNKYLLLDNLDKIDTEIFNTIINNDEGIIWTRNIYDINENKYVLNKLNCTYMFVGHNTVNNIILNNNIWFVDSGLSRSYGRENYEYIRIIDNKIDIIKI
tara:strand:- start:3168 stop:4004 length:837 start_codon:yes stop_codon:yes gene_type:complete